MGLQVFAYIGAAQAFVVPAGVSSIVCDCQGAEGAPAGSGGPGRGGRVQATLAVTPGMTLQVNVGGQAGFNGGGSGSGFGGGASDIRWSSFALADRLIVAGGGGGAGNDGNLPLGGAGGDGGGTTGESATSGGGGGTPSAGGAGAGDAGCGPGDNGSLGLGGASLCACDNPTGGGGGGGGYYGGGAAGCGLIDIEFGEAPNTNGGGGGSSYVTPSATSVTHTQGFRSGNGIITLSWEDEVVIPPTTGIATLIARPGPLGCGEYQAMIRERGGGSVVDVLDWTQITFGRRVDDMSSASVTLDSDQARRCSNILRQLKAWRYELSIFRDRSEVWAGPLRTPHYEPARVDVRAADLFAWFERRCLPFDRNLIADLAHIFEVLVDDALAVDRSPNIDVRTTPTGIVGKREIASADLTRAADVLRELSRSAIDWTMVARELRIGGGEVPTAALATLIDDTLERVTIDPVEGVSDVIVFGDASDTRAMPVFGRAVDVVADIGIVQVVVDEPSIGDNASATFAAETRLEFYADDPLFITGSLHPSAPIDFDDLVPGARINVALADTLRGAVVRSTRLTSVDVTVSADAGGTTEDVRVSLGPLGTVSG